MTMTSNNSMFIMQFGGRKLGSIKQLEIAFDKGCKIVVLHVAKNAFCMNYELPKLTSFMSSMGITIYFLSL